MRLSSLLSLAAVVGLALTGARADDVKSGPDKKIGGAFDVNAVTGDRAGKQLCYV